jgi:hypothetical protein
MVSDVYHSQNSSFLSLSCGLKPPIISCELPDDGNRAISEMWGPPYKVSPI